MSWTCDICGHTNGVVIDANYCAHCLSPRALSVLDDMRPAATAFSETLSDDPADPFFE